MKIFLVILLTVIVIGLLPIVPMYEEGDACQEIASMGDTAETCHKSNERVWRNLFSLYMDIFKGRETVEFEI